MNFSEFFFTWNEFAAKTENENVLEETCRIELNLQPRQKMKFSQIIVYNWNEFAAKTENENLLEQKCRISLNLRLRQKMKFSWRIFLKLE